MAKATFLLFLLRHNITLISMSSPLAKKARLDKFRVGIVGFGKVGGSLFVYTLAAPLMPRLPHMLTPHSGDGCLLSLVNR